METPNTSYAASQFLTGSLKHFTVSFDAVTSFDTYTLSSATIKYDDDVTAALYVVGDTFTVADGTGTELTAAADGVVTLDTLNVDLALSAGGTTYNDGIFDVTLTGGTGTKASRYTIVVANGVVTSLDRTSVGVYTVLPTLVEIDADFAVVIGAGDAGFTYVATYSGTASVSLNAGLWTNPDMTEAVPVSTTGNGNVLDAGVTLVPMYTKDSSIVESALKAIQERATLVEIGAFAGTDLRVAVENNSPWQIGGEAETDINTIVSAIAGVTQVADFPY